MRLVRITHYRCRDYSDTTFALAPDEWTEERIQSATNLAQKAYLAAFELARAEVKPPNDFKPYGGPPYKAFPDKTVAEVTAEWEAKKEEYEAWKKEQDSIRITFERFLKEHGLTPLWDTEECTKLELDWGHRHGQPLVYGDRGTDTLPTPGVLAGTIQEEEYGP